MRLRRGMKGKGNFILDYMIFIVYIFFSEIITLPQILIMGVFIP